MARKNRSSTATAPRTHEGAVAARIDALQELTRTVLACMLWEDTFYEDGQSVADRIASLVPQCDPHDVAALARRARTEFKLRHVPLWLCVHMARNKTHRFLVADTLEAVIQRPDELAEFLSLYLDGSQRSVGGKGSQKQKERKAHYVEN